MSGGLLLLSFHGVGTLFREDLLFKQGALDKGPLAQSLITHDLIADTRPRPALVAGPSDASGGIVLDKHGGVQAWSLNRLLTATWKKKAFKPTVPPSDFEAWFKDVLRHPAELLVVAGHHALAGDSPMFWGAQHRSTRRFYYPQTGFWARIEDNRPVLSVVGYRSADSDDPLVLDFDASAMLAACRLVIVLGCSGVDHGAAWQKWVQLANAGKKQPLILGWYGTHSMPNARDEHFSQYFWQEMRKAASSAAVDTLTKLIETSPTAVIKAWGAAQKQAFAKDSRLSHLWVGKGRKNGTGAGAVEPGGKQWKAVNPDGDIEPQQGGT